MNSFDRPISARLAGIFLRNGDNRRPVYGAAKKFQDDPHWRDLLLFYEYFHGDNGAGLGASHQTGWTALVAALAQMHGPVGARSVVESARVGAAVCQEIDLAHGRESLST